MNDHLERVDTLTFDIFGTVLDLTGGITPTLAEFLERKGSTLDAGEVWKQWRARQRIEQFQDTLLMLGHSGYVETARRGLVFTLRNNGVDFTEAESHELMKVFDGLRPFDDAANGLLRLGRRYKLVALSNGNKWLLDQLVENHIDAKFDASISIDSFGRFKPHPAVYRGAAQMLGLEPGRIMMVAAHSFDIHGARACGFRGAYVNRYRLPYEETQLQPDFVVDDFLALCEQLGV